MLNSTLLITGIIVFLALAFDFINGFHDTANAIATSVSTRVLSPMQAIGMSAVLNLIGALISVSVAKTIGSGLVDAKNITMMVVIAALLSAILWNLITWYYGIPSSSSHALIGAILGSAIAYNNSFSVINWTTFFDKVILWLVLSTVLGFVSGYLIMTLLNWILRKQRPSTVTNVFSKLQIASAAAMAFNHGSNDAQKSMGVIAMALVSGGVIETFTIPTWVKLSCAIAMALGTSVGGWKIIKTMGTSMAKLAPVNGFAAEAGAAAIIATATALHAPVSTTHIISTSIMGVGASKRLSSVRWIVAKNIVWAWIITIPFTAFFAAALVYVFKMFM